MSDYSVTYIPKQFRVRMELSRRYVLQHPQPPAGLLFEIMTYLESEVRKGNISFYRFFELRLQKLWQVLQESNEHEDTKVAFTLAAGAPPTPGVIVSAAADGRGWANLTITMPVEHAELMCFNTFKLVVGQKLRDLGLFEVCNPALLHGALYRRRRGAKVEHVSLIPLSDLQPSTASPYQIQVNQYYGGIELVVWQLAPFQEISLENIVGEVVELVRKTSYETGVQYRVLRQHLVHTIASALRGPERYGIDMPMVILVGVVKEGQFLFRNNKRLQVVKPVAKAQARQHIWQNPLGPQKPKDEPHLPYVSIEVTEDRLNATIGQYDPKIYDYEPAQSLKYWTEILKNRGIVFGYDQARLRNLIQSIRLQKPLENFTLAIGQMPTNFADPYLEQSFQNRPNDPSYTQRRFSQVVRKDELIAQIKFHHEGVNGMDVFGKVIPVQDPEIPFFEVGEGVRMEDGMRFFAAFDGKPLIEDKYIGLEKFLLIEGNLDSASGKLIFTGNVAVQGNIETGSTVEIDGNLTVTGSVSDSQLAVRGDLQVGGGILNCHARLICRGQLQAAFIENSRLFVDHDVVVNSTVLGCQIRTGGWLRQLDTSAFILGSEIYALQGVDCQNLGKGEGAKTLVAVGDDPWWSFRFGILAGRKEKLIKKVSRFASLSARAKKVKKLIAKIDERLDGKLQSYDYQPKAQVIIRGVMHPNVSIQITGVAAEKIPAQIMAVRLLLGLDRKVSVISLAEKAEAS